MTSERRTHMTKEEALRKLKELHLGTSVEKDHQKADEILCALLTELGYKSVVLAWRKVHKWYA